MDTTLSPFKMICHTSYCIMIAALVSRLFFDLYYATTSIDAVQSISIHCCIHSSHHNLSLRRRSWERKAKITVAKQTFFLDMSGAFSHNTFLPSSSANSPVMSRGRKRSRTPNRSVLSVAAAVVFAAICNPAAGFSLHPLATSLRQPLHLQASAKVEERPRTAAPRTVKRRRQQLVRQEGGGLNAVSRVKPRKAISDEKRKRAMKAMKVGTSKIDSALSGVDAQMLELLSENFLYPENLETSVAAARARPKGRPEFVPGAMNYDTMLKFRERQEFMHMVDQKKLSSVASTFNGQSLTGDASDHNDDSSTATTARASKGVKGARNNSEEEEKKKRKRVVKSLPEPRSEAEKAKDAKRAPKKRTKGSNLELHKYYRTELLSADEEYSLGMKVQFMMKCEQVHEGLSTHLMRLPTIKEWAEACG